MMKIRNDDGSLPLAMLLTIVAVALSALLVGTLSLQLRSTRYAVQRSDALDAAEAGIQVGVGHIRSAGGTVTQLPCGPYSGAVVGATQQAYTVTLYYLSSRPPAGNTTWAAANKLSCTGTYLTSGTPLYVMLASTGRVVTGGQGRTVTATYPIHSASRDNLAGGLIHAWSAVQPPNPDLCFSATNNPPNVGDPITIQICDSTNPLQKFTYNANNQLVLVATLSNTAQSEMCLEASSSNGQTVKFKQCSNGVPQQINYNLTQNLEGSTGNGPSGICYNVANPGVPGGTVVMASSSGNNGNGNGGGSGSGTGGCGLPANTTRTFLPDILVGLGAVLSSGQLASFRLSGYCLSDDVGTVDMQACQYGTIDWNMIWTLPDPALDGPITATNTSNKKQCLVSPGTITSGSYVTVVQCPTTIPASMICTAPSPPACTPRRTGSSRATAWRRAARTSAWRRSTPPRRRPIRTSPRASPT